MTAKEGPVVGTSNLQTIVDPSNTKGIVDLLNNSSITIQNSATTATIGGVTAFAFTGEAASSGAKRVRVNNVLNTGVNNGSWCMETWVYFKRSSNYFY
jgi:hypothetical protein